MGTWSIGTSTSSRWRAPSSRHSLGPFQVSTGCGRFDWRRMRSEQPALRSSSSCVSQNESMISNDSDSASAKPASSAGTIIASVDR